MLCGHIMLMMDVAVSMLNSKDSSYHCSYKGAPRLPATAGHAPGGLAVGAVNHVEVHVELGGNGGADRVLDELHQGRLERAQAVEEVQIEVGHGYAHLRER
jgi:hypothetical protein